MYLRDVLPHAHPRFVGGWAETLTSSGLLDSVWKSANSMGHNKRKIKVKEGQKLYNKLYNEMIAHQTFIHQLREQYSKAPR